MRKLLSIFVLLFLAFSIKAQGNLDVDTCLYPFYHGVASGDPLKDKVVIWTRVTPDSLTGGQVLVSYKVATDTGFTDIVANGSVITDMSKDYTVKVDVDGLSPETFYFYEFVALGKRSATGRTKTAPDASTTRQSARFGIVSCANLEAGYFNVYKVMNERNDMDAVLCLGDYIYEYETGGYSPNPGTNRVWEPSNEIISLADYRMRYSTYRLDGDLRRNHQLFPWICVWDDHESANDSYTDGAENHTEGGEGTWVQRKAFAKQAYFEWLPVRETGVTDPYQLYRSINYGPLCDLIMLDTRLIGRDEQAGTTGSTVTSQFREMLGPDQRDWMNDELINSTAQWKVMVQQVMMAPLEVAGIGVNGDQWDGYPAERERFYATITDNFIENVVVVTGDIHTSWANDLPGSSYNSGTGAGSMGVEFVAPSVTSPGFPIGVGAGIIQAANSHMKFVDLTQHGFILLDIDDQRAQGEWYFVNTIDTEDNSYTHAATYYCNDDTKHLQSSASASIPPTELTDGIYPYLCPRVSEDYIDDTGIQNNEFSLLSVYPNPASDFVMVQYFIRNSGEFVFDIINAQGQVVQSKSTEKFEGLYIEKYSVQDLEPGMYFIRMTLGNSVNTQRILVGR